MQRQRITESQLRLLATTTGTGSFRVFETKGGWAIKAAFREKTVEIETERGHLREWKQLSAVAHFIKDVSPMTSEFVVALANDVTS